MRCPHCQSEQTVKNGTVKLQDQSQQQRYMCRDCNRRFNERTNTPMARLRTPVMIVASDQCSDRRISATGNRAFFC
jgi:transposase-like protein